MKLVNLAVLAELASKICISCAISCAHTSQVFPEGLAPLASKLDELCLRSVRKASAQSSRPGTVPTPGAKPEQTSQTDSANQTRMEAHLHHLRSLAQSPLAHATRKAVQVSVCVCVFVTPSYAVMCLFAKLLYGYVRTRRA